jgi:hypothetical protein
MNLTQYRDHVKRLSVERKGESIYNGSADHATIIVENILAVSRQHVRILTGDLNAKVYGTNSVVHRAREFLAHSGRKLEVLVENVTFNRSHPLIEEIGNEPNATFYHIPEHLGARIGFHFMTADNDCFRFEAEKNSHAATAAFGDGETTEHLNKIFDMVRLQSPELDKAAFAG